MSAASERKMGEKFKVSALAAGLMLIVLVILLAFGVRSDTVIIAWLGAFVAIPTQFSIANAAVTRKFAALTVAAEAAEPAATNDGK